MSTLSVVIPHGYGPGKDEVLQRCIDSIKGEYDELIIVGNDKGICWANNVGIAATSCEYVLTMNDDATLERGHLRDLIRGDFVTHPTFDGIAQQFGSGICYPRWVLEALGPKPYDEGFEHGYFEDDDIFRRLPVPRRVVAEVNFAHPDPGHTLHMRPDWTEVFQRNKAYFESKHGLWSPLAPPLILDSM